MWVEKRSIARLIPIFELYRGEQSAARPSRYTQYPLNGRPVGPLSQPRYLREYKKCLPLPEFEILIRELPSRSLIFTPSMIPLLPPPRPKRVILIMMLLSLILSPLSQTRNVSSDSQYLTF